MKTLKRKPARKQNAAASTRDILDKAASQYAIRPRWAWHYKTLMRFRERLLEDQQRRVSETTERLEPHSMSEADSASDEFDHDLALSGISSAQETLVEVDQAMRRILNGSYGICEETGAAIPTARLRAIPWTRFSKSAERQLEKSGVLKGHALGALRRVRSTEVESQLADQSNEGEER